MNRIFFNKFCLTYWTFINKFKFFITFDIIIYYSNYLRNYISCLSNDYFFSRKYFFFIYEIFIMKCSSANYCSGYMYWVKNSIWCNFSSSPYIINYRTQKSFYFFWRKFVSNSPFRCFRCIAN